MTFHILVGPNLRSAPNPHQTPSNLEIVSLVMRSCGHAVTGWRSSLTGQMAFGVV